MLRNKKPFVTEETKAKVSLLLTKYPLPHAIEFDNENQVFRCNFCDTTVNR